LIGVVRPAISRNADRLIVANLIRNGQIAALCGVSANGFMTKMDLSMPLHSGLMRNS
jgi:hypothetical protein